MKKSSDEIMCKQVNYLSHQLATLPKLLTALESRLNATQRTANLQYQNLHNLSTRIASQDEKIKSLVNGSLSIGNARSKQDAFLNHVNTTFNDLITADARQQDQLKILKELQQDASMNISRVAEVGLTSKSSVFLLFSDKLFMQLRFIYRIAKLLYLEVP